MNNTERGNRFVLTVCIYGLVTLLLCVICFLMGEMLAKKKYEAVSRNESSKNGAHQTIEESTSAPALRDRIAVKENLASVEREMERSKSAGPQGYEVIMNTEWVFSTDGETPSGKAFVENGRDNNNAVYFYVTLEEEPEEVLYTSPVLEVGDKIQSFALDKTPPIGTYRGIVTYCLLDETGSVTGQVNAGVVIRVE